MSNFPHTPDVQFDDDNYGQPIPQTPTMYQNDDYGDDYDDDGDDSDKGDIITNPSIFDQSNKTPPFFNNRNMEIVTNKKINENNDEMSIPKNNDEMSMPKNDDEMGISKKNGDMITSNNIMDISDNDDKASSSDTESDDSDSKKKFQLYEEKHKEQEENNKKRKRQIEIGSKSSPFSSSKKTPDQIKLDIIMLSMLNSLKKIYNGDNGNIALDNNIINITAKVKENDSINYIIYAENLNDKRVIFALKIRGFTINKNNSNAFNDYKFLFYYNYMKEGIPTNQTNMPRSYEIILIGIKNMLENMYSEFSRDKAKPTKKNTIKSPPPAFSNKLPMSQPKFTFPVNQTAQNNLSSSSSSSVSLVNGLSIETQVTLIFNKLCKNNSGQKKYTNIQKILFNVFNIYLDESNKNNPHLKYKEDGLGSMYIKHFYDKITMQYGCINNNGDNYNALIKYKDEDRSVNFFLKNRDENSVDVYVLAKLNMSKISKSIQNYSVERCLLLIYCYLIEIFFHEEEYIDYCLNNPDASIAKKISEFFNINSDTLDSQKDFCELFKKKFEGFLYHIKNLNQNITKKYRVDIKNQIKDNLQYYDEMRNTKEDFFDEMYFMTFHHISKPINTKKNSDIDPDIIYEFQLLVKAKEKGPTFIKPKGLNNMMILMSSTFKKFKENFSDCRKSLYFFYLENPTTPTFGGDIGVVSSSSNSKLSDLFDGLEKIFCFDKKGEIDIGWIKNLIDTKLAKKPKTIKSSKITCNYCEKTII